MNRKDVVAEMRDIAESLQNSERGAHWSTVRESWQSDHPEWMDDLGTEIAEDWLRRISEQVVSDSRRSGNGQLELPGVGRIDATVTVPDGEGGYAVKSVRWATAADLIADLAIHDLNVEAALGARTRARLRNDALIPAMEAAGALFAGEVLS